MTTIEGAGREPAGAPVAAAEAVAAAPRSTAEIAALDVTADVAQADAALDVTVEAAQADAAQAAARPVPAAAAATPRPVTGWTTAGFIALTVLVLFLAVGVVGYSWPVSHDEAAWHALARLAMVAAITWAAATPWWRWRWSLDFPPWRNDALTASLVHKPLTSARWLQLAVLSAVCLIVALASSFFWDWHRVDVKAATSAEASAVQPVIDSPMTTFSKPAWGVSFAYPQCFTYNAPDFADIRAVGGGHGVTFSWLTTGENDHLIVISINFVATGVVMSAAQARQDVANSVAALRSDVGHAVPGDKTFTLKSVAATTLDGRPAVHFTTRSQPMVPDNLVKDNYIVECPNSVVVFEMEVPEHDYAVYQTKGLIARMVASLKVPHAAIRGG